MRQILSVRRRTLIPTGLIIPFDDTSIPTDWERFTSADGMGITGAGLTYSPGDSGGASAVVSRTTANDAGHLSSNPINFVNTEGADTLPGGSYSISSGGGSTGGIHNHTISCNYDREYQQIVLIRATANQTRFPANAIILGSGATTPVSGLSIVYDDNILLKSGSSITTGGGAFTNEDVTSGGGHTDHETTSSYYDSTATTTGYSFREVGSHVHTFTPSISAETLKRTYLTAWKGTSAFNGASGVVGMWEGIVAPPGWKLMDGTNGTLDMRDYSLMFGAVGTAGDQYDESNSITVAFSVDNATGYHTHAGSSYDCAHNTSGYHGGYNNTHNHTASDRTVSYTPEYYALTFIQKA